jgi:hypothetical protein
MDDSLIPNFGKYYIWCCPNRDNSMVESNRDVEQPALEGRRRKVKNG